MKQILFVDDENRFRQIMARELAAEGFWVDEAASGEEALQKLSRKAYGAMILDLSMPDMGGLEVLEEVSSWELKPEILVLSGKGTVEKAVKAIKLGAFDFLEKPCSIEKLKITLNNAFQKAGLEKTNQRLGRWLHTKIFDYQLVGTSEAFQNLLEILQKASITQAPILLEGESGTGKEVFAKEIHRLSPRKKAPFIDINCANLPHHLFESILFGHEKGAFTGADQTKEGLVETATGGTLFLDEISEIPLECQAKLLRFLETSQFRRVGGKESYTGDIRIIASTNQDIEKAMQEGRFRKDLYYRINVVHIRIPPLRERREDILPLFQYFLKISPTKPYDYEKDVEDLLLSYDWPGNVRELRNMVERLKIFVNHEKITKEDLRFYLPYLFKAPYEKEAETLEEVEKIHILRTLKKCKGNKKQAAEVLGISVKTLYNKLHHYQISLSLEEL